MIGGVRCRRNPVGRSALRYRATARFRQPGPAVAGRPLRVSKGGGGGRRPTPGDMERKGLPAAAGPISPPRHKAKDHSPPFPSSTIPAPKPPHWNQHSPTTSGMLSIIIPAHNEAPLIGATLDALREATARLGADTEVIVVDDASSDDTAAIARGRGARVLQVELRHIAAVRNAGAAAARGDR